MYKKSLKTVTAISCLSALLMSPAATSHFDDKEIPQSYRQSYFALLAANFGPMVAMVKEEIEWDQTAFERYANDLATVTELNLSRGFPDGSDSGKTRAKSEIWENKEDFESKIEDLKTAASEMQTAAASGDKKAIMEKFKATGGACKACHDDYKAENYLN